MEYLEDLNQGEALLPADPKLKAHSRLWSDHVNRKILPHFYSYLQAQTPDKQAEEGKKFKEEIKKLVQAADPEGPFFLGSQLSFVDIQFAPWVIRLNKVLKPYRGWPEPEEGSRWAKWIRAIEEDPAVKGTTSGDELYSDSYERYAGELLVSSSTSGCDLCKLLHIYIGKAVRWDQSMYWPILSILRLGQHVLQFQGMYGRDLDATFSV